MGIKKIREFFRYVEMNPLVYTENLRDAYLTKSVAGNQLKGKKVMITGGTGGIGVALALRFLCEDCHIMLCARNKEKLDIVIKYLNDKISFTSIEPIIMDLKDENSIVKVVEALDSACPNILVNNAGVFTKIDSKREFFFVTKKEFSDVWDVNYKGTVLLSNLIAEKMNQSEGVIINISSICADSRKTQFIPYGISKAAIKKYTAFLSEKYENVQTNAILPGSVATSMIGLYMDKDISRDCNALYHPALPEEIAALAAFLATGVGKYLTEDVTASACEIL